MKIKIADLMAARTKAFEALQAAADDDATSEDAFETAKKAVMDLDAQILRVKAAQALSASTAVPSDGQEEPNKVPASVENDPYIKQKSLLIGGIAKTIGLAGGNAFVAPQAAAQIYGENHPVTKALATSVGSSGGFLVPPDVMTEVIELLRPKARVRAAGPRNIPMPRGTMTLPSQNSAATASYGSEGRNATKSQQSVGNKVATYKKLTAFVPISNDMMRYANPAIDALVRDDLVKVMAIAEDRNFILSDGTQDTPRGFLSFANGWVQRNNGTVGVWSRSANSTLAVNAVDPSDSTGGNFITSTSSYTLATVASELGGAVNRLDTANVDDEKRVWFMAPRSRNYLYNVQNSLGVYVYRDELSRGTLFGYPVLTSTQIGTNWWNADGSAKDLSFVFLVEMTEDMIFDSMQLELSVSREGTYYDENNNLVSAFQRDETLIRAISEHDHQMRHDEAIAVIQGVRWAPAIQ
ncbi:HK97 family phage major capsid protein [Agrobacterium vitis]|nr:HK97 family phage major capsid protein [Agrobacterium vitis]